MNENKTNYAEKIKCELKENPNYKKLVLTVPEYKIITICASKRYKRQVSMVQEYLIRKGNMVFIPEFQYPTGFDYTSEMIKSLHKIHYTKINNSDIVLIVDCSFNALTLDVIETYVGDDTNREYEYAKKSNNAEIYCLSSILEDYNKNK